MSRGNSNSGERDSTPKANQIADLIQFGTVEEVQEAIRTNPMFFSTLINMQTPMMLAVSHNRVDLVRLFLAHKVSTLTSPYANHSLLQEACRRGFPEMVELLVQEGKMDPNATVPGGIHPVLLAASKHHLEVLKVLDKNGANFSVTSARGVNAIHEAITHAPNAELLSFLISKGVPCDVPNNGGYTPLMYASIHGAIDDVQVLVEQGGANPAYQDPASGVTALSLAESNRMSEVIFYFWRKGLSPSSTAMPSHLGEMSISRPRLLHAPGARYNAAVASIGSVIYMYGGEASADPKNLPVYMGTKVSKSTLPDASLESATVDRSTKDDKEPEDVSDFEMVQDEPEPDNEPLVPDEELDERQIMARIMAQLLHHGQIPEDLDLRLLEEQLFGQGEALIEGQSDEEAEEEEDDYRDVSHLIDSNLPSNKTYMLDVDECCMTHIVPIGSINTLMKKIELNRKLKGSYMHIEDDGRGGGTINPKSGENFPPCLAITSTPFSMELGDFGYFEVLIINPGPRRLITLGLIPKDYPVEGKQPGWIENSFGFHGDDGKVFCADGLGENFGDRFEPGDIIGCGIIWSRREVFFTQNGRFLGFAPGRSTKQPLYPCVGLRNVDAKFRINFGLEPFRFDFRAPTLSWKLIDVAQGRDSGYVVPRLTNPYFAKVPSGEHLVLMSFRSSKVYFLNLQTLTYQEKSTTGFTEASVVFPNTASYMQVQDRFVFIYLPRTSNKSTSLSIFDTELLRWLTINYQSSATDFPNNGSKSMPQLAYLDSWAEVWSALDDREMKDAYCSAVNGMLLWTGRYSFLIVDPITGIFSHQPLNSKPIAYHTGYSSVGYGDSMISFAGWDGTKQTNDLAIFNTISGVWYSPSYSGVVPRNRNYHSAVTGTTISPYLAANAVDLPSDSRLKKPVPFVAQLFGWSGKMPMNDADFISFSPHPVDEYLNNNLFPDLQLLVSESEAALDSSSQILITIPGHKSVLSCRSSKFKDLIQSLTFQKSFGDETQDKLQIVVSNVQAFKGLIQYYYTEKINFDANWRNHFARPLVALCDEWSPSLSQKLLETLLLVRSTLPSIMGPQLLTIFQNANFPDVTIASFHPETSEKVLIPAHKVVLCSRSPYFNAIYATGMSDAKSQELTMPPNVHPTPLSLVLEFLYSFQVPYDKCSEWIVEMFILSCMLQIDRLKILLENVLVFNLSPENAPSLLLLGHEQGSVTLTTECFKYITSHKQEVTATPEYISLQGEVEILLQSLASSSSM